MKKIVLYFILVILLFSCGKKEKETNDKVILKYTNVVDEKTSKKYQSDVEVYVEDDKLPNAREITEIFKEIQSKNKEFENYFISFNFESDERERSNLTLFKLRKIGENKIQIENTWETLFYEKSNIINENYNKISGFIKYSDVDLNIGESINEIKLKMGETIFNIDNKLVFIVFNKVGEIIGNLYLNMDKGSLKGIEFQTLRTKEIPDIINYFLGNKNIKIKSFENNGINIKTNDFERKFNITKSAFGNLDSAIDIDNINNYEIIKYKPKDKFVMNSYIKNRKINKIELIYNGEKTEESYNFFLDEARFIYIFSGKDWMGKDFYDILGKLNFTYDKFMSKKEYTKEFENGYLKYRIINKKNSYIFEIINI